MNRQQRRKLSRQQIKQLRDSTQEGHKVGWKGDTTQFDNFIDALASSDLKDQSLGVCYVSTPTQDRQAFELTFREFGECIQVADTHLETPRIVNICVFKPHPYETSEEMYKVCYTILKKYSPFNVYAIGTATPPDGFQMDNMQHVNAFAQMIIEKMRALKGETLAVQLFQQQLEMTKLN